MKTINNELLLNYIQESGLKYKEIASETMISRGTLYNISWGKNHPSYLVMSILADYLEFTKEEFLEIFFPEVDFKKE